MTAIGTRHRAKKEFLHANGCHGSGQKKRERSDRRAQEVQQEKTNKRSPFPSLLSFFTPSHTFFSLPIPHFPHPHTPFYSLTLNIISLLPTRTYTRTMISRLLAEAPAVSAALRSRTLLNQPSRSQPARLLSTATILRAHPGTNTTAAQTTVAAAAGATRRDPLAWTSRSAGVQQRYYNSSSVNSTGRLRLFSATTGSRLVSRAYSSTAYSSLGRHTVPGRPFALPRRHSALQFYRTRHGNLIARRGIAATAAPRFIMHALRLPMGALTAGLASLSYAQYKVTGNIQPRRKSQKQILHHAFYSYIIILTHAACYPCVFYDRALK